MNKAGLVIHLLEDGHGAMACDFALERSPSRTELGDDLSFKSTDIIKDDPSAPTYRGILSASGQKPRRVVCKLRMSTDPPVFTKYNRRLRHEADIYETKLQDMQGSFIPKFYGLFTGSVASKTAICILLEDCGVCVGMSFGAIPFLWRYVSCHLAIQGLFFITSPSQRSVEILLAIHERGVQHNDVYARNVVVDDRANPTRMVLVDFDHATEHRCERPLEIELYYHPPPQCEFKCQESYAICDDLCIWTPGRP